MKKKVVNINESKIKKIVSESIRRVLKEMSDDTDSCYQEIVDFINYTKCDYNDCVNAFCYVLFGSVEELIDGGEYGMDVFYVDWNQEMRKNTELKVLTNSVNNFVEKLRTKYDMETIYDAMHKINNQ